MGTRLQGQITARTRAATLYTSLPTGDALPMGTSLGTTKSFTMKMPSSPALVVTPKTQSTLSAAAKQLRNLHSGHKNHAPVHHQPHPPKPSVTSQASWTSLWTS